MFNDLNKLRLWGVYASISVAGILIIAKLAAYIWSDSVSVLVSLIDSALDCLISVLTLAGVRYAQRPPDRTHRFGHGKAEPLAALAQGAFIVGMSLLLVWESLKRLVYPEPVGPNMPAIGIMVLSIVLTLLLLAWQKYVVRRTGSLAVAADSLHYSGDFLMNLSVIVSLAVVEVTGWWWLDSAFAFVVAVFWGRNGFNIAHDSFNVLLDRELSTDERQRIFDIVGAHPACRGMHDLRTRTDGSAAFIEFHLELDGDLTLDAAHDITDTIEKNIQAAFPAASIIIHQEPAGLDDSRLDHQL